MKYWEYDCLVVTPHALYHIENKDWAGNLKGDEYAWFRNGQEVANLHLFCNNNHGGTVVAGYFTINHTAQLNNLDPEKYLMYIFSRITDPKYRNMPELLEEILPWNRHFAVQICYLTPWNNLLNFLFQEFLVHRLPFI